MKAFRFPLQRVLQWRAMQCQLEDAVTARLTGQRDAIANAISNIVAQRMSAANAILDQPIIAAVEIQTVAAYQTTTDQQIVQLKSKARELDREIAAQLRKSAEARRKKKLLETLREDRLEEWTTLRNAEDEAAAADSWLSRFAAERYTTTNAPEPNR